MILSTTPTIEGRPIQAYKGVVTGEAIIGANFVAKEAALQEMQARAEELGCNAVVGIDIDYETVGQSNTMLMVVASGTAVEL